jgi:PAS domain S-box-containing protein
MKLRSYLILFVVAAVLPVVIFACVMTYLSYQQQRENIANGMIERARAISAALDREFLVSIQSLKILAASTHLDKGELSEFYGDMKSALAAYSRAWQNITLTDSSGQQLINLRRPFGSPLPATRNPEAIERVRQTKEAAIANLSLGPVTGAPGIVVHVPIVKDGKIKYFLNAVLYPAPLTDLILEQKLPSGWLATIIDRNQVIVARTREFEKFFGKPASATFASQAKQQQEATWHGTTVDGSAVFAAHHRSDFSGWTVGLASPAAVADAPLRTLLMVAGAGGVLLLLGALSLAIDLGRRIAEPASALSRAAETLGRGETPEIPSSPIAEMSRLAEGLGNAATLRIQAEEQLRYQLQLSRSITDKSADSIFVSDDKGRATFINPEAAKTFGFAAEELLGQPLHEKIHHHYPDGRPFPREECVLAQIHATGKSVRNKEDVFFRKDGSAVIVECSNAPLEVNGQRVGAVLMARDVTDRKEADEALRRARESLEEKVDERTRELIEANVKLRDLDRLKSQFLANMSHELRTPLNAIIGFSELMHDGKAGGPVSAEQKEYLGDILNSATHLLQLINDVLDLSKVEAGRMEVLKSTVHIEEIISEVTQNVAPIMSVKELKLVRDVPPDLPPIVTDRRKLLQILLNLASNAVKFTDRGEIRIRCQTAPSTIELSVSDTGLGIKPEELPLLFQPFSQIDGSLRKRHEGTGLGLYLSERLVTLLGGDLTVASEYGKGSTFTITLPLSV